MLTLPDDLINDSCLIVQTTAHSSAQQYKAFSASGSSDYEVYTHVFTGEVLFNWGKCQSMQFERFNPWIGIYTFNFTKQYTMLCSAELPGSLSHVRCIQCTGWSTHVSQLHYRNRPLVEVHLRAIVPIELRLLTPQKMYNGLTSASLLPTS